MVLCCLPLSLLSLYLFNTPALGKGNKILKKMVEFVQNCGGKLPSLLSFYIYFAHIQDHLLPFTMMRLKYASLLINTVVPLGQVYSP